MICSNCKKEIPDNSLFCPYCGQKIISTTKCPNCGTDVAGDFVFCPSCGSKMIQDEPKQEENNVIEEIDNEPQDDFVVIKDNKPEKKALSKKDKYILARDIVITLICVVMFIMSFFPIFSYKIDLGDYGGSKSYVEFDGISTPEAIKLMFISARNYNETTDQSKITKLEKEVSDAIEEFSASITTGRNIDKSTHKLAIAVFEYGLSLESANGTQAETILIFYGLFSLIYILFSGLMVIFAIITLIYHLQGKGTKFQVITKLLVIYIFLILALLFIQHDMFGDNTLTLVTGSALIDGIGIASLLFASLLLCLSLFDTAFLSREQGICWYKKLIKISIPTIMIIIASSCIFAPSFKAYYYTTSNRKASVELNAGVMLVSTISEEEKETYEKQEEYTLHSEFLHNIHEGIDHDNAILFSYSSESLMTSSIVKYALLDLFAFDYTPIIAGGYYLSIFIFVFGALSILLLMNLEKRQMKILLIFNFIFTILLILISLIACVTLIGMVAIEFEMYDIVGMELTIGPGYIVSFIMFGLAIVSYCLVSLIKSSYVIKIKNKYAYLEEISNTNNKKQAVLTQDNTKAMRFAKQDTANEYIEENMQAKKDLFEVVPFKKQRIRKEKTNRSMY